MTKFTQDVILTLLDGLVIGVLVAIAGFVLNRLLERYKAKEAFTREIMRVRVDKMGEIWSALYEWTWLNDEWMSKIREAKLVESGLKESEKYAFTPDELKEQATTQNQDAQKRRADIEEMLERERFWLSEALYKEYRTYFDTERRRTYLFFQVFLTDDSDKAKLDEIQAEAEEINKAADKARMDVLKVTETLGL